MATTLEKLCRANRWRIRSGQFASTEQDGWNGHFLTPLEGELWHIIISDGMGFRHLSVTNAQKKMLPPYNVLVRLKDAFFGDDAWVVFYFPPPEEHINVHPFCLHLWESLWEPMPHPLIALV